MTFKIRTFYSVTLLMKKKIMQIIIILVIIVLKNNALYLSREMSSLANIVINLLKKDFKSHIEVIFLYFNSK